MFMNKKDEQRGAIPHALCVPFPLQGHIKPMLELAKLLHQRGFHITFVNTEFNHNRLVKSLGPEATGGGLSSFRFVAFPDGLPPSDPDSTQDVPLLSWSSLTEFSKPFRELVKGLKGPPVTCVVSDGTMSFTHEVAEELHVPLVFFWTCSASGFNAYLHFPHLLQKNIVPLKSPDWLSDGCLDTVIDWIPGMKAIQLKHLPSYVRTTGQHDDDNYICFKFFIQHVKRISKASAIILNTSEALEADSIDAIRLMLSPTPVYTTGPLQLLRNQFLTKDDLESSLGGGSLWKEDVQCLKWLDEREAGSVVYVNFGSITVVSRDQLIDFAWGLADSKFSFLWIIRPDLVEGASSSSNVLPPEFVGETRGRGMLASWCPQERVLKHPSVGCFLTHCGWNSTLESVSGGVPMLCWPSFSEQQTNCWHSCTRLGVGMEIVDQKGNKSVVKDLVREMMIGEKGVKMKENALKLKDLAHAAVASPKGSSYLDFEDLIANVLLPPLGNN